MQNKLSILFVTNNYIPYNGGVVSSIDATAGQLREMGHKVFIITLDFLGKQHVDPYFVLRVPCPITFMYKKNHMAVPWRVKRYLLHQIKTIKPDVVHVHHPFLLGSAAAKLARKLNIPVIFTYHTMYEKYLHYVPLPQLLTRPFVMRHVLKFCKKVDGIVAPSKQMKHYLRDHNIQTPIDVVPSPVQPFFIASESLGKKKEGPFHLLTASRFRKEKNLSFLLDVFARLPKDDFMLTLAGYGSDYQELKEYAYETLNLSPDNVQFIYDPEKSELKKLYKDAHLFLFSSTSDTQGLVLAEAMGGGTPVIALDGAGQRDIVDDGKNGFLVENADQMIEKINQVAQHEGLYDLLSEGAIQTAHCYNPKNIVSRLIKLYRFNHVTF